MSHLRTAAFAMIFAASPALGDDVTDTLDSAMAAYADGDISYAIEELDYAKQLLQSMQTGALADFLPEAPDGWSREDDSELGAGMAMFGGGTGASARYFNDAGEEYTLTILADSPMITMMSGMITNAAMMGLKMERVGREKFVNQDGELSGLIGNRILVQASGADIETMKNALGQIDYKALGSFGE
ncbi:hypothetical protein [Celeribacter arenosi]|uniref:Uncharacterized protein n=1 Tax=Celeribacter arenosi TaxID=792649 RepID=A0ABP7K5X8_9RHOB